MICLTPKVKPTVCTTVLASLTVSRKHCSSILTYELVDLFFVFRSPRTVRDTKDIERDVTLHFSHIKWSNKISDKYMALAGGGGSTARRFVCQSSAFCFVWLRFQHPPQPTHSDIFLVLTLFFCFFVSFARACTPTYTLLSVS